MKLSLEIVTANHIGGRPCLGAYSVKLGFFPPGSTRRALSRTPLRLQPTTDRDRSSTRDHYIAAPASGLGGNLKKEISRLEEANREWLVWRFGDDD